MSLNATFVLHLVGAVMLPVVLKVAQQDVGAALIAAWDIYGSILGLAFIWAQQSSKHKPCRVR